MFTVEHEAGARRKLTSGKFCSTCAMDGSDQFGGVPAMNSDGEKPAWPSRDIAKPPPTEFPMEPPMEAAAPCEAAHVEALRQKSE